jgi:hypothetical protein
LVNDLEYCPVLYEFGLTPMVIELKMALTFLFSCVRPVEKFFRKAEHQNFLLIFAIPCLSLKDLEFPFDILTSSHTLGELSILRE